MRLLNSDSIGHVAGSCPNVVLKPLIFQVIFLFYVIDNFRGALITIFTTAGLEAYCLEKMLTAPKLPTEFYYYAASTRRRALKLAGGRV